MFQYRERDIVKISARDKKLLANFNKERWNDFIRNQDASMTLPEVSMLPKRSATKRLLEYKKEIIGDANGCHAKLIGKRVKGHQRYEPEAFIWQTTPDKLKQAVRWGVIHTESITSRVIGTLGHYRVTAHEIIAKGMISNTHAIKMALLDLYQDRFEKLQALESLVNKDNSQKEIMAALELYHQDMQDILNRVDARLKATDIEKVAPDAIAQIKADIEQDRLRASKLASVLSRKHNSQSISHARGYHSILEFVKTQMMMGLYELQGINQDMSFSTNRTFALTRGRLNDCIEDARKVINDHQPDLRNAVNKKHHGDFALAPDQMVVYDFSQAGLTHEQERHAMTAVSFIEGWDRINLEDKGQPRLQSKVTHEPDQERTENLVEIAATRWRVSRSPRAFLRKAGLMLLNMLKSFVVSTKPWKEDENFPMVSHELHDHSKENRPVWYTPYKLIKRIGTSLVDIARGAYDAGRKLFDIRLDLVVDWHATGELPDLSSVMRDANELIEASEKLEKFNRYRVLHEVAAHNKVKASEFGSQGPHIKNISIAQQDYQLVPGEANDLLNSMVRGVSEFSDIFTHELFAKNPVAGCAFVATYGLAGATIVAPTLVSFLGPKFIAWQNYIAYKLGASQMTAAVSLASIEAQIVSMATDGLMHGPTGTIGSVGYTFVKNPLQLATFVGIAFGTGYLLSEVIAKQIPVLGDIISEEVNGSFINYNVLGIKFILVTHAILDKQAQNKFVPGEISYTGKEQIDGPSESDIKTIERFIFAKWLAENAKKIRKLPLEMRSHIERHIDNMFSSDEAKSLRKLVKKEKIRSIAYQVLAIPLNYIPSLIRILISPVLTIVALIKKRPHAAMPITRAFTALGRQIAKDISRVPVFLAELARVVAGMFTGVVKMLAYVISMAVSRLGSIHNLQSGHGVHRFFGYVHMGLRKIGDLIYPAALN